MQRSYLGQTAARTPVKARLNSVKASPVEPQRPPNGLEACWLGRPWDLGDRRGRHVPVGRSRWLTGTYGPIQGSIATVKRRSNRTWAKPVLEPQSNPS